MIKNKHMQSSQNQTPLLRIIKTSPIVDEELEQFKLKLLEFSEATQDYFIKKFMYDRLRNT